MSALVARRYCLRGYAELNDNRPEDACQNFQAAVQMVPSYTDARIGHALALLRLNDAPRAVQTLRAGLHHAPRAEERVALLRTLGDALLHAGDFPGAEQALSEAAQGTQEGRSSGDLVDLHGRLARLRARTGRFPEAFDELLRAARLLEIDERQR